MVEALKYKGWHAETLFYTDDKRDEIFDYIVKDFDAYVPASTLGVSRAARRSSLACFGRCRTRASSGCLIPMP
jgi:hypothetical protein